MTSKKDESGIISLIIVAILSVVMALVAVGFAKLTDRELTQASDRELSAQAFYAAEAGINDARAYLKACDPANNPPGTCDFTGCTNWPALGNSFFVSSLDGSGGAKYTCVSVNTQPTDLITSLDAGQSKTIKLSTSGLATMTKLFFGWQNKGFNNNGSPLSPNFGSFGTFPQESSIANPATTGVLRVDIYPIANGATSVTNDALAQSSRTYFLYPNGGSGAPGSVAYTAGSYSPTSGPGGTNGAIVAGNCKPGNSNPVSGSGAAASYCNSVVTGLSGSSNADYYLRLTAMYTAQNVTIQATGQSQGNGIGSGLPINGTQAIIDVTGKGTDVLQRIRARIDLTNQFQAPGYGLQSMVAICKGFTLDVTDIGQYSGVNNSAMPNNDNACATPNGNGSLTGGGLGPH